MIMKTDSLTKLRNANFVQCCAAVLKRHSQDSAPMPIARVIEEALECQPRAYYMSYDCAARKLRSIARVGLEKAVVDKPAREMWTELQEKVEEVMQRHAGIDFSKALSFTLNFCRPKKFYISPPMARRLLQPYVRYSITVRRG